MLPPNRITSRIYTVKLGSLMIVALAIIGLLASAYFANSLINALNNPNNASNSAARPPSIIPPSASSIKDPPTPTPAREILVWNGCGSGSSWGSTPCRLSASQWYEYVVPDTFDLFVSLTSNVTVTVYFLTLGQYTQYAYCGGISCVSGFYRLTTASTSIQNYVFKLAEGCADYVMIFQPSANASMNPDLWVTHNAAPTWTGICSIMR